MEMFLQLIYQKSLLVLLHMAKSKQFSIVKFQLLA